MIPITAPKFTLAGIYRVRCIKVYDGDTITVVFPYGGTHYRISCRLHGFNCAEMKAGAIEAAAGVAARAALASKILNLEFDATFGDFDKYGRPLITFNVDDTPVDQFMIKGGWAKPYTGAGEKKW